MRVPIPFGSAQSVLIVKGGRSESILIQNVSAVPAYISDSQTILDGSIDSTGTPQEGLVLQPNDFLPNLPFWTGGFYARSNAPGCVLEVITAKPC